MDKLTVKCEPQDQNAYDIYFSRSYDGLMDAFKAAGLLERKICIVTDSNVAPLYLDTVKKVLGTSESFIFEAGEGQKHFGTLQEMFACFLAQKLDRRSVVAALGGGVTGDLAGFAAATYMRGLTLVQLPTSLLAQVDAGVGGKTAVDFDGVKNLVGAFYQPRLVYMNLSALKTLPRQEFISGMGEVVKHGLIGDSAYYEYIQDNIRAIQNMDADALLQVVAGSCRIKAAVVAKDEREMGLRETLNFGHCVGHSIESLSEYALPHGHCVAVGMGIALQLSHKLRHITSDEAERAIQLIRSFDLPVDVNGLGYAPEDILSTMYKDKKTLKDTLRVVLLKKIGEAYTESAIPQPHILEALKGL